MLTRLGECGAPVRHEPDAHSPQRRRPALEGDFARPRGLRPFVPFDLICLLEQAASSVDFLAAPELSAPRPLVAKASGSPAERGDTMTSSPPIRTVRGIPVALCPSLLALAFVVAIMSLIVPSAASAESLCTNTWTGPSEGSWLTAADWSAAHVPTSTDVACIGSGKTVKVTEATNQTGVLQGEGTLTIIGGSLEVVNALEGSTIQGLNIGGGTLKGAATLIVSGAFSLSGQGSIAGLGKTVLRPSVSGSISGEGLLSERALLNEGTLTLEAGELFMSNGAQLQNAGTFDANAEGPPGTKNIAVGAGSTSAPLIVNTGTFAKTQGGGTNVTQVAVAIENHATVHAQVGILAFEGGGTSNSASEWTTAETAKIKFNAGFFSLGGQWSGTFDVRSGVTAEGLQGPSATVTVGSAGSLTVPTGVMKLAGLSLDGTLTGAGTLALSSSLSWSASGTMAGPGRTVVEPGASWLAGGLLTERTLVNEGTGTLQTQLSMANGALLENRGTFIANLEGSPEAQNIAVASGSTTEPLIINTGTFEKTASEPFGTKTTRVAVSFENLGIAGDKEAPYFGSKLIFTKPIVAPESTQYGGAENPSTPGHPNSQCGGSVACATGNESTSQTDLTVGGRGVGLDVTRTYNAQAAAAGTHGAFGYGWSSSFSDHLSVDKTAKVATLYQANASTVAFAEGSGGTFTSPATTQDSLSGTPEAGYTLTRADQIQYKFAGSSGRLESITDRNGNATTLSYGESGRLETIADPAGRKITLAYNQAGLIASAKDPMGHVAKYTYESGNLATVTLPGETAPNWQFKYDGSHEMTSQTDGRGGKTTREYNAAHQVTSETDPMERKLSFEYEAFHTRITNKATGAVTDEYFTSQDEPSAITLAFGTTSATTKSFSYDAAGDVTSITDGNGDTTHYTYDGASNRTGMLDADKDETKWGYNATHDIISTTTPKGETTTIKRDSHGNPETIERPAPGGKTQLSKYQYASNGDLESVTDPLERVTKYEYNGHGDRTAETDPAGDKRTWTYDEDSRESATVSPRGHVKTGEETSFTTKVERDEQGRVLRITNPLSKTTIYTYDANGNVATTVDSTSDTTTYTYDADNERTKVKEPTGTITETGYDGAGLVTSQTDGRKHVTNYVRNILGEVVEVVDPLLRKAIKEYDLAGNLRSFTDPAKRTTTYIYDPANRLTEVSYSDGKTPTVKYEYDADGERTNMIDGTGTTTYGYDQLDRLTETKDGHGDVASYEYDLAGQQTKITYPNGKAVTRAFDKAGRLEKVTDWLEHITNFSFDADSELTTTSFPGGLTKDTYTYNNADQQTETVMRKGFESLASLKYGRDANGSLASSKATGLPGGETEVKYNYDKNRRLTNAGTSAYEYDAADNATLMPGSTNTYDAANELEKGTGVTYSYDELGSRTKRTPGFGQATTYGYDQAGNMTSITRPKEGETQAIEDSYTYDGSGLRASQTIGASTSYLTWNTTESLPVILNDGVNSYLYGPDAQPIEQVNSAGTVLYLHHDQQGSTRLLTSSSGVKEASVTYDAYGNITGTTGTANTPLGYDAQYTSSDTGLIYMRARTYDPATAQFVSRDPFAPISGEPYSYSGDNPLNADDPSGLLFGLPSWEEVGEGIAGAGDTITFGATKWVREQLGINNVDVCSGAYQAGGVAGLVVAVLIPGEGEVEIGAEAADQAIGGVIRGYTRHGLAQAIGRDAGRGVSPSAILDAVRSPLSKSGQADGATKYVGQNAVVVVSSDGRVVTTYARSAAGLRGQP
jgi:RHS repeat-associated protein